MKLVVVALITNFAFTILAHTEDWWRVFGEVETGNFRGGDYSGKELSKEQRKFLTTKRFDEWEVFEDEFVKIVFPKHPELKLTINKGEGGIRVEGGVCTTVDNSFNRAYELKVGETVYGVFLLFPADWLDDGI